MLPYQKHHKTAHFYGRRRQSKLIKICKLWAERSQTAGLSLCFQGHQMSSNPRATHMRDYLELVQDRWWRELHLYPQPAENDLQSFVLNPNLLEQLEVLHSTNLLLSFDSRGPRLSFSIADATGPNALLEGELQISSKLRDIEFNLLRPSCLNIKSAPFDLGNIITLIHKSSRHLSTTTIALSPRFNFYLERRFPLEVMPSLRHLNITGNVSAARILLRHITAPVLEKLHLGLWEPTDLTVPMENRDQVCIYGFLARSSSPLSELTLYVDGFRHIDLREILSQAPQLRRLQLVTKGGFLWTSGTTETFIGALRWAGFCPELEYVKLSVAYDRLIVIYSKRLSGS